MIDSARISRKRSSANFDRHDRRWTCGHGRAAYSARAYNRAVRHAVRCELRFETIDDFDEVV